MTEFRKSGLVGIYFEPHKDADYSTIESRIHVFPVHKTIVRYNPALEPGSPEFWGMIVKAGFIHWCYERNEMPIQYSYWVRRNRRPRGRQLEQPAQNSGVEA